jgi:ribosomal protein S12 methylthiotransferase
MDRFKGQTLEVLIEERIDGEDGENFLLGRLYCQAPEIDGAAVIADADGKSAQIGKFSKCKVIARRGIDLEVKLL